MRLTGGILIMLNDEMDKTLAKAAGQALEAPAKEAGKQIAQLIDLIFTPVQALKIWQEAWLNDFKQKVDQKYQQIPDDRLVAPPLNIIGPALEASKYYMATEKMREMFANLVAHACDSEMKSAIHPSFVNILAQISPLEASILSGFRPKKEFRLGMSISLNGKEIPQVEPQGTGLFSYPEQVLPIVNYYLAKGDARLLVQSNVIKSDITNNTEEIAAAITNLIRLGLIETSYQMHISDEAQYSDFFNNDLYQTLQTDINPGNKVFMRAIRGNTFWGGQYNKIQVEKGIVRLTQFGYNFMKVCVLESEVFMETRD